jgi:ABC-2 type transport system ATP-binding protein
MLRVENLSKRYRAGNYGVRDVSLALESGVVGLLGPNGAGKTTLMQLIATITRPTEGRIVFDGIDTTRSPDALRRRLGYRRRTSASTTTSRRSRCCRTSQR